MILMHFDLLRKPPSTVSIYADECGLLVLTVLVTSAILPKKFFGRMKIYRVFVNTRYILVFLK